MDEKLLVLIALKDKETQGNVVRAFNICFPDACIETTYFGYECIQLVKDKNPDIVILDSFFDDMEGNGVLENIRAYSNAPVIMMAYSKDEKRLVAAFELGASDYMVKPVHQMELIARARSLLRTHRAKNAGRG